MSYYFALFLALFNTHTVKLSFKPTGQVVMLNYKNAFIYTDTTALLSVYHEHGNMSSYDLQVAQLIRRKIKEANKDTVSFYGSFIPFDGLGKNASQGEWAIGWVVTYLVNENKAMVFDKNNILVKRCL